MTGVKAKSVKEAKNNVRCSQSGMTTHPLFPFNHGRNCACHGSGIVRISRNPKLIGLIGNTWTVQGNRSPLSQVGENGL